jgi:hypothetical protein
MNYNLIKNKKNGKDIFDFINKTGVSCSNYRLNIYKNSFSGITSTLPKEFIIKTLKCFQDLIEQSIKSNKRDDGLFHAYNLISFENRTCKISHLPEMLEGQVAVLSSGMLSTNESLELLDSLKVSKLFRDDQYSYILYPNKDLPGFLSKNNLPKKSFNKSILLKQLIKDENLQIVVKDIRGVIHFNGNFQNSTCLEKELENLPLKYYELMQKDKKLILEIFEEVFNHKAFTGRSGTFFAYEGLGSIYWHMVSKLLLSVYEVTRLSIDNKDDPKLIGRLFDHYFEINEGIGVNKSPVLYGAFPTDPYSHTPFHKGVQQPGMTGQVKEDILSRFGELGLFVDDGMIFFKPDILRAQEFLDEQKIFKYISLDNKISFIELEKNSLGFTCCQVPIIYKLGSKNCLKIFKNDNKVLEYQSLDINTSLSNKIFKRTGEIVKIELELLKK